jgi:hypothetical protein
MLNYHIAIAAPGAKFVTVSSTPCAQGRAFDAVRDAALACYRAMKDDEAIEITSGGLTVWGPFVKGSKFTPTGA